MVIGWPHCAGPLDERCLQTGLGKKLSSTMIDIFAPCAAAPGDRLEVKDIWEYTQDLLYTEIDGSLLRMFCRSAWTLGARTCAAPIADTVDSLNTSIQSRWIATFLMSI
jgi:hypothetical protein